MALDEERLYRLLGARVRAARHRIVPTMSQAKLADRLGVSRASIVNIEAGKQRPPLHVIWKIADAIGVDATSLLPSRADYEDGGEPFRLDREAVEKIEKAAEGDPGTRRLLTEFIGKVLTRSPDLP
jgi:transcriptional regulator with XRE-family HTH domain